MRAITAKQNQDERIGDQQQESKRHKVNFPRYQCYRVDHCKKSAPDTKDGAGAEGTSRNKDLPQRGGRKASDGREAQH